MSASPLRTRRAASLLTLLLSLSLLMSTACIVALADHDCTGEGCEQCEVIELSSMLIGSPSLPAVATGSLQLLGLLLLALVLSAAAGPASDTPVGLKVRINS